MVEQYIKVNEHLNDEGHIASTVVIGRGRGFWVSTVPLLRSNNRMYETLVFVHPRTTREDWGEVLIPELNQYNMTNIPTVREARSNHGQAVQAAVSVLQSQG